MPRRGLTRGRSASRHRATEEFQPPSHVTAAPPLLDFPVLEPERDRSSGAIPRRPKSDVGKVKEDCSTWEVLEPRRFPRAEHEDPDLRRRQEESWEEFGSRIAVEELERFVQFQEPKTSVSLEQLKEKQRAEIKARKPVLRKEDLVYPDDEELVEEVRPITPPGPRLDEIIRPPN
ncbi:uncharacterized protein LOC127281621 [Leptopilina boulardi]|uniref:uncharacterized protein LOC127281621 n=1 Tax=Leptopilina boulardi TaxID=63433 RepID=UPI0021F69328|nr:uncharacterized protein LOC127281621 [Leptopilina boulardi]